MNQMRLVVMGDGSFLRNINLKRFDFCATTHLDILRNSVNWLLEREERISISPRKYQLYRRLSQIDISDRSIRLIMWGGMMGMPFLVLLAGVLVWVIRKK